MGDALHTTCFSYLHTRAYCHHCLVLDREALFVDLTLWPPMAPTLPGYFGRTGITMALHHAQVHNL